MKSSAEKRLDALKATYEAGVEALARDVREKYLIPFCDKNDLRFVSGMGSWAFWARRHPTDRDHDLALDEAVEEHHGGSNFSATAITPLGYLDSGMETRRYRCKRLLDMLHLAVDEHNDLGMWMDDYCPSGEEKSS